MDSVRNIYRNYALAWETSDADLWLSIWNEAGTQMPPGIATRNNDELDELTVLRDLAFARGHYICDYTEEYAHPRTDGKF